MRSVFYFMVISLLCSHAATAQRLATKGFIPIKDSKLYYESRGEGEAIVLLHAGFLDYHMWQSQVKALQHKYRVITLDMPAHGLSQRGMDTFLIADALVAVLDSLKIQKASWMGLSLGAVAVTDFLIAYPERVHKAILVSPGINGYETKHQLDSFTLKYFPNLMKALEQKDTAGAAEVFTQAWGDGPFRAAANVNKEMRSYVYNTTLATMYKFKVSGWPRFQRPPAIERIHQIKAPLLIIAGDKDMPYILEASEVLRRTVPGAKKVIISDVAHMLNMEKPEEFNKAILSFLAEYPDGK